VTTPDETPRRLRLLIADDHPVYRDGLRLLLGDRDDVEVVGAATDGEEAVRLAAETAPDVVVMDVQMPRLNGIEATRRIVEASPGVGVLVLTMYEDDESVFSAVRAGARGYVLKGADELEILHAVRAVARGEAIFGPALARRIGDFFADPGRRRAREADERQPAQQGRPVQQEFPFPELTPREVEVLRLVAEGHNNVVIAGRLFLSHKTVRNHVSSIFAKLQVADRAEAIVTARRSGLGVTALDEG
jgi:DNA-binding NarL/FixJ family response regulator